MDIHGYTMYILGEYTWYILGYTWYIHIVGYVWYIQGYTIHIPYIYHTYLSGHNMYGIYHTYTRHIPKIGVPDEAEPGARRVTPLHLESYPPGINMYIHV